MTEICTKSEITVKKFTEYFNIAVRKLREFKYNSMEFTLDQWRIPKEWYLSLIKTTHLRGYNLYPIKKYDTVVGILFLKKPCIKFNQLISWLDRYAEWPHSKELLRAYVETRLYVADVCGKRGRWSKDDERRRDYLCHNEAWCERVKKQLQKIRNTGDKVEVARDLIEDFENMEESIYNETELYGSVLYTLRFRITTPGGKIKFDSIIY